MVDTLFDAYESKDFDTERFDEYFNEVEILNNRNVSNLIKNTKKVQNIKQKATSISEVNNSGV
jgi:hypothetical protein